MYGGGALYMYSIHPLDHEGDPSVLRCQAGSSFTTHGGPGGKPQEAKKGTEGTGMDL